jgi:hypothetical protein
MTDLTRTSAIKLGLAIAWPAFWTGVPLKIVLVLLFLAAGLHPWEMPALAFLLLLSIPIDIWALGLTSRSVFLERLRREPPEGLGLTLWWQIALLSAIYFPIAYLIESQTISLANNIATHVMDLLKGLPVAERIGIELVLWGSVALAVLIVLILSWLSAVGMIVRRQAAKAQPSETPYPVLVMRWDLMRIPADQTLALTVFVAAGLVLVMLLWAFMPVTTPHPHEDYKKTDATAKATKPLKPTEVLQKTENVIAQAESSVKALEAKAQIKDKGQGKANAAKDQAQATPKAATQTEAAKPPTPGSPKPAAAEARGSTGRPAHRPEEDRGADSPSRGHSKDDSTPHSH